MRELTDFVQNKTNLRRANARSHGAEHGLVFSLSYSLLRLCRVSVPEEI